MKGKRIFYLVLTNIVVLLLCIGSFSALRNSLEKYANLPDDDPAKAGKWVPICITGSQEYAWEYTFQMNNTELVAYAQFDPEANILKDVTEYIVVIREPKPDGGTLTSHFSITQTGNTYYSENLETTNFISTYPGGLVGFQKDVEPMRRRLQELYVGLYIYWRLNYGENCTGGEPNLFGSGTT